MTTEKPYVNLLEEAFPGIRSTITRCRNLGFSWQALGFSGNGGHVFVKERDGNIASHVAVLDCRVLLDEKWHRMAALHAVCTKKNYQGQGLASELVFEALQWAKSHFEFQILFTEIPSFYERLDFAAVQEHRFSLKQSFPKGGRFLAAMASPKDDSLFLRCFKDRRPLSHHFWVEDRGEIASFTTLFGTYPTYWSLYYSEDFDGLVSWYFEGDTLHILDIVADILPSFELIMEHLPQQVNEIYFYFPTDRLGITTTAEPYLYDKGHLMVQGVLPTTEPFMIAPLSRC